MEGGGRKENNNTNQKVNLKLWKRLSQNKLTNPQLILLDKFDFTGESIY